MLTLHEEPYHGFGFGDSPRVGVPEANNMETFEVQSINNTSFKNVNIYIKSSFILNNFFSNEFFCHPKFLLQLRVIVYKSQENHMRKINAITRSQSTSRSKAWAEFNN